MTCWQVGIDGLGRPLNDFTGDREHCLGTCAFDGREQLVRDVNHALGNPVMIAQIDEHQVAVITLAMHPTRKAHSLANMFRPWCVTRMGTEWVHSIGHRASPEVEWLLDI